MLAALLSTLVLALSAQAATLKLQSPKLVVTDSMGTQLRSDSFSLSKQVAEAVELGAKDILKMTFQVLDQETGNGVQPHQTFLRFYDEKTNEEGIQPVRVTPGGKAKFELNLSKPPLSLPPTPNGDPLKVSLIIGTSQYDPISVELFDLVLPKSQPAPENPLESTFHVLPEIHHTFRADNKMPPQPISFAFIGIVLAPWAILLSLWSQVVPKPSRLFSPSILPFVASLGAFEGLLFWYWVDLKLGQVLLYGFMLSLPTFFAGKTALASIGSQRLGRK
ncbi:oligosaccharyl transferase delta subunit [Crepidotus variabilis]|uniref:Ribophorin II n=1 Tax=Crepidotus variabilis TaxID=179855 RepID=A0A9P6EG93_9AGAR|nr:oligosaccharyl transferase delta subunit [Crepidotus variabilis]